jgi:hypothetical protein
VVAPASTAWRMRFSVMPLHTHMYMLSRLGVVSVGVKLGPDKSAVV